MGLCSRAGRWIWQKRINGKLLRRSTGVPIRGLRERRLAERRAFDFEYEAYRAAFGYNWGPREPPPVPGEVSERRFVHLARQLRRIGYAKEDLLPLVDRVFETEERRRCRPIE
jgi:hypothetical protein